jgi:hypothetical protein
VSSYFLVRRGRANDIRISLYVDDTVFFINLVKAGLEAVRGILSRFGEVAGLHVNFAKIVVIRIRCEGLDVVSPLGARVTYLPCKFLGLPLSLRKLRKVDFQPLLGRIASRLVCWKAKLLFAHAFHLLDFYIHLLPTTVRKEIDRIRPGLTVAWR